MSETTFIYALCDPRDGRVRYVGKSNNPEHRLLHHVKPSSPSHLPLIRWVNKLRGLGMRPVVRRIMAIPRDGWQEWERHWIQAFRWAGEDLLNITDGGDGGGTNKGQHLSLEHREKIGAANRGKPKSAKHRAALSRSHRGKHLSEQHRMAISAAQMGRLKPAQSDAMRLYYENTEAHAKTSEASRRIWRDPARLEAARARRLGWKHSQIVKDRIRIGHIIHNMRRELYGISNQ